MLNTRNLIAERFREEHGSYNVHPYFIGVFDTVAAMGKPLIIVGLSLALVALIALASFAISLLSSDVAYVGWLLSYLSFERVFLVLVAAIACLALGIIVRNYVKYDFRVPGYGFLWRLATIHLAPRKEQFTDHSLDVNVDYAKHASPPR